MIRKHSAKVLTLRNVVERDHEVSRHFVLIGGFWYYNGSSDMAFISFSDKDGFWTDNGIKGVLENSFPLTLEEVKKCFYTGPNKSMQIATREWTTNQKVYGVPF